MANNNRMTARRKQRTRIKIRRNAGGRPRLSVFRSGQHIYVQLIDDAQGLTVAAASTLEKGQRMTLKSMMLTASHGTLTTARCATERDDVLLLRNLCYWWDRRCARRFPPGRESTTRSGIQR